ncbi:MAG: fibronectin type III domain-containing protein, partial [Actinomycetota bacterium]
WSGSAWVQLGNDLDGTAGDTQAGSSVALSEDGSRVAYGSSGDGAGSVKVLQWSGSAWVQVGGDVVGETLDDQFGFSIDLSAEGTAFAAGAISNQGDEIGASAGHVRVHGSVSNTPVPDAPTNVIATAGNGQVDLSWNAPANPGGSAIIGYTATATPGGATCTTTGALTCTVSGLTNGTPYSFTVVATNSDGSSAPSEGSAWVTPAAAPSAPTGVFGVPNDSAASIGWSEPADDGGSPVISYVVTASPGGSTCSTDGTLTCIVPNLTNGTQYTFTVTATNAVGTSGASDPSDPVTPAPVPGQPLGISAVPGSGLANVSWSAPATAGTDNIIAYTATASPGGARCATTGALTCTVAGLTNGTEYTFTVTATNAIGTGDPSDPSDAVMPVGAPLAPRSVAATAQPASAVVAWAAPLSDGGSAITGYTATTSPGSSTCSTAGTLSCTVTGLSNGTAYTFTITATNALGTSPSSTPSDPVTPTDVPVAPTAVAATAGNAQAAVSWAGSVDNGGSPISAYTVTSSPAGGACATAGDLTCTVTGLTNGTTYTFTVTATNDNGLSPASDPSNAVTPSENPNTPQNVTVTPDGDGNADVSWDPPPNPDGDIDGYVVTVSPDGEGCTTDGETTCTVTGLINGQTYTFTVVVVIDGEEGVGSAVTVPGTGIDGGTVTGLPGSGGSTQGDAESEPGTCPAPLLPFDDANTVISVSDVACIYGLGITGGTTPTTYSPNQAVDRNQMASFIARLWRAAGLECPAATASFVDLSFAISAADVSCIWAIGITGGTTPTTYSPGEAVDRNQMASFLARLWRETGRSCPSPELPFTDVDTVISVSDVACIYGLGITGGTTPTTYSPNQTVDRNQMASFLARLWRALGDD